MRFHHLQQPRQNSLPATRGRDGCEADVESGCAELGVCAWLGEDEADDCAAVIVVREGGCEEHGSGGGEAGLPLLDVRWGIGPGEFGAGEGPAV